MRYCDVAYAYPGEAAFAIRGFDLALEPGSVTALLGPNGSGKSTALGLGSGWLKPNSGRVEREGEAAFLPQSERLAFPFDCVDYVSFGRAPRLPYLSSPGAVDRRKAYEALEAVGAGSMAERRVSALSGGELQLVRLARAIVQEAPFVILDEPTDALDPYHAAAVAALVRRLADSGKTVLLSTHDAGFALASADFAALVSAGRVESYGPAARELSAAALSKLYGTAFSVEALPSPFPRRDLG